MATPTVPPLADGANPPAVPSAVVVMFTEFVAPRLRVPLLAVSTPPDTWTVGVLPIVELATAASSAELVLVPFGAVVTDVVTFDVAERLRLPEAVMVPLSTVTAALEVEVTAPIFTNPLKRLMLWLFTLTVDMADSVMFFP